MKGERRLKTLFVILDFVLMQRRIDVLMSMEKAEAVNQAVDSCLNPFSALVCKGCHIKVPQARVHSPVVIYFLPIMEAWKSEIKVVAAPLEGSEGRISSGLSAR